MKRFTVFALVLLSAGFSLSQTMTVHKNDHSTADYQLSEIDSITFSLSGTPVEHEGNFLSWTGSWDTQHYFELVRVNGQNGSVTSIGGNGFFPCLEYSSDGTLYGISNELHVVNPANGATVKIGDFRYNGSDKLLMAGAAFSPGGTLYVMGNKSDSTFTVNLANASLTYVGKPVAIIMDMEFSSTGALYASFSHLFTLNPINMQTVTDIGSTGSYICALTFGKDGILFGMDNFPSSTLYSLNLGTGHASSLVSLGSGGLISLVAERTASISGENIFGKAAKTRGLSRPRSQSELLELEKAMIRGLEKKYSNYK
jgi:hypothetical protein